MIQKIYFIFFIAILFLGCNENRKVNLVEAKFDVNDSLLGRELRDTSLNFSIYVPGQYQTIDDSLFKLFEDKLQVADYKKAKLLYGFISQIDSSSMLVLDVSNVNGGVFEDLSLNYISTLNANDEWYDVQKQDFTHNCFEVEQYLMQNRTVMNFKLVCYPPNAPDPTLILVYFINRNNFKQNIKSVESSIGYLKCITKK